MFRHINISTRLLILILILTTVLLIVSAVSLVSARHAQLTISELNGKVGEQAQAYRLTEDVRRPLQILIGEFLADKIKGQDFKNAVILQEELFRTIWQSYIDSLDPQQKEFADDLYTTPLSYMESVYKQLKGLDDQKRLAFITQQMPELTELYYAVLQARINIEQLEGQRLFNQAGDNAQFYERLIILSVALALIIALFVAVMTYRSITQPLQKIAQTITSVEAGDLDARCALVGSDELSKLGEAFDHLIDEKLSQLIMIAEEKQKLDTSISNLLVGVNKIAGHDLTVELALAPDITGTVADQINHLVEEFSQTLGTVDRSGRAFVRSIQALGQLSNDLNSHINSANDTELQIVRSAVAVLGEIHQRVAQLKTSTQKSLASSEDQSVIESLDSLSTLPATLSDLDSVTTRLFEQIQRINTLLRGINIITERTNTVALNAKLRAVNMGTEGESLGVIADEVKYLATQSQKASDEIGDLINTLLIETQQTARSMTLINQQFVDTEKQSIAIGEQIRELRKQSIDMIDHVAGIASAMDMVRENLNGYEQRMLATNDQQQQSMQLLAKQEQAVGSLSKAANALLNAIGTFSLPTLITDIAQSQESGSTLALRAVVN